MRWLGADAIHLLGVCFYQAPLFRSWQAFNCALTFERGTVTIRRFLMYQGHGESAARVFRPFTRVVNRQPRSHISGNTGVERTIGTA